MATKAQIKASNAYNKKNTVTICLRLNKATDGDVLAILNACENKSGYIKELVRKDHGGPRT